MIVILLGLLCRLNAGGESAHVPVLELDKLLHQEASDQQRREQGHDNAQQQRLGEALHRAGAEDHQHDGGDNGGHVRVDDGAQRVVEAGLEGNLQAAARADFLIEALEDNDIGVHRHADAQHDTGNARQGQLNAGENRQHPEQHDCVNAQRPGGDHAVQAVADNHDEHDQRDADDGSENGGGQRIIAQRGGHGINLLLRQHQRQRAGLNLRGDGLRTIHREVAGNLTGAAGDGGLHGGRHQLLAVQIDAQRLADVLACHVGKELRARGGQLEGNRPLTVLRHGGLRQTDVRAGHEGVAVRILELQEGGFADQVQDFARIAHIRDFNADAARAQHLHGAFGIALVGQTGLNGGNGRVQQVREVRVVALGRFGAVLHIHAAAQVKTQRNGLRPSISVGRRQPRQELPQPALERHARHADDAEDHGQHQHDGQCDDGFRLRILHENASFHSFHGEVDS